MNIIVALLLSRSVLSGQSDVEALIEQGINFHDKGDFEEAIDLYNQALALDTSSTLAMYELSLSYFTMGNYEESIRYADMVLERGNEYALFAYVNKGSSLDLIGKTEESIALFEEAIEKTEGHYLLYYNLALNHYKVGALVAAESAAKGAIDLNSSHPTSHLLLANIHNQLGNKTQSILSSHFFLFLEPNTDRSKEVFDMIKGNMSDNVTQAEDGSNDVEIELTIDDEDDYSAAELMLSIL